MLDLLFWIGKSILIIAIFQFVVPPLVNTYTLNSWGKLPVMIVFAFIAGVFMAWLHYTPDILPFVWLYLTYYTLQGMTESKFESESGMKINKAVFYVSSYSYVVFSCLFAMFFQLQMDTGNPGSPSILVWRHLLGLH